MFSLCQERKAPGWGVPCRKPSLEPGPTPGVRTGFPSLPGAPHPASPPNNAGMCTGAYIPQKPLLQERGGPHHCHQQPSPARSAKSNLSTGSLPLVRSHNQVGDNEEDVLSLRNQKGVEEPPPALLGTLLPRDASLTSESLSRCPWIGPFQAHNPKLPPPMDPYSALSLWGPSPDLGGEGAEMGWPQPWPRPLVNRPGSHSWGSG